MLSQSVKIITFTRCFCMLSVSVLTTAVSSLFCSELCLVPHRSCVVEVKDYPVVFILTSLFDLGVQFMNTNFNYHLLLIKFCLLLILIMGSI